MKYLLILLLSLLVFPIYHCHAKVNHYINFHSKPLSKITQDSTTYPFVSENNRWNLVYGGDFTPDLSTVSYTFAAQDTLMDNGSHWYLYKELLYSGDEINYSKTGEYYRNENLKVYKLISDFEEVLVYDFDLEPGDSISLQSYFDSITLNVIERDTLLLLDDTERIRLTLNDCNNYPIYWVEGIGNIDRISLNPELSCSIDVGGSLSCYYHNDELVHMATWAAECWISPTINISQETIKVYPNPTNYNLNIKGLPQGQYNYRIHNTQGILVQDSKLTDDNIDTSSLENGMYFLKLWNDKGVVFVDRFIKME
jgi:hypothetical protein